jgi:hypothetical protein
VGPRRAHLVRFIRNEDSRNACAEEPGVDEVLEISVRRNGQTIATDNKIYGEGRCEADCGAGIAYRHAIDTHEPQKDTQIKASDTLLLNNQTAEKRHSRISGLSPGAGLFRHGDAQRFDEVNKSLHAPGSRQSVVDLIGPILDQLNRRFRSRGPRSRLPDVHAHAQPLAAD